ncbi:MAG: aspartate 4-decarboxylase [Alicyclobacillus sp.]|nr:aspartate 4-decarboxylase [Alicyclobacillus sp.]
MELSFEAISPFELKNELIRLAEQTEKKAAKAMLDAGRGNPNWIAATPREAFFALGQFAVQESRRVWDEGDLAGKPALDGIYERMQAFLCKHGDEPGVQLLARFVEYGIHVNHFQPDAWVHELVDGIIGDNYPVPDRMLTHIESIVHDYILQEMCQGEKGGGRFQLFAVEGATAAMCYLFECLSANHLLQQGDRVAIMVPIFPPYVEIPQLDRYRFDIVPIRATAVDADGNHTWQYPPSEIEKLKDPSIKALFLVNPSNPPSVAMVPDTVQQLVDIVEHDNPNLMIITDDVYGTFVENFRSLMADLPYNTICVYSFSKYFGVTGWRLGVICVNERNVFDRLLEDLPADRRRALARRYSSLSRDPGTLRFIDRLVADSRQVALNHTAGLSTPQQVQMALLCGFALLDRHNAYKRLTMQICQRRMKLLYDGLGLPQPNLPNDADYYTEFDFALWAEKHYGPDFVRYLQDNYEPVDILFRLAEESSVVLLNGGGFYGPTWSLRVSLANLDDDAYARIGEDLHKALETYVARWRGERGEQNGPTTSASPGRHGEASVHPWASHLRSETTHRSDDDV